MNYAAINIGPVVSTIGMARKPRELWAASYLFSHLMKCIYAEMEKAIQGTKACIISPAKPQNEKNGVGIYPDRIYIRLEDVNLDVNSILNSAKTAFANTTKLPPDIVNEYFNVMSVSCEADKDSLAIARLNQLLDVFELCQFAADKDATPQILKLIGKTSNSPLFALEKSKNDFPFPVNTLAEIATARLCGIDEVEWDAIKNQARESERKREEDSIDLNEDSFYKELRDSETFKGLLKSHHKYFCVVQADGDNVGSTVSHPDLQDGQVGEISKALVKFGSKATELIEGFGGLPIYAGGDDLLFIAPVVGKEGTHIFNLLESIENDAFKEVKDTVARCGAGGIEASLSFGISISYYKYPLYEALEKAKNLLFNSAKCKERFPDKKAVAWSFRKHSGGTFDAAFSLKNNGMKEAFYNLIDNTVDGMVVSAVAHKLREMEALVKTVMAAESELANDANHPRLNALFDKVLEFQDNAYFHSVKKLMPILYKEVGTDNFIACLYSLMRTAKFIKGEDLHDE